MAVAGILPLLWQGGWLVAVSRLGNSVTFQVDDVEPVTAPVALWKTHEGINALLDAVASQPGERILSCSGYNSSCMRAITYHPVIAAVHTAFAEHRPLCLSPDIIWTTILQGFALHVRNNHEALRSRLVSHNGRKTLMVTFDGYFPGSPENDWSGMVDAMAGALRGEVGTIYDALVADFSTTGDLERTVSALTILDAFEPYFEYQMMCICGIPSITLEGTSADWQRLRQKVECLAAFDLDWWLSSLRPILDQFERASRGDIDLNHWQHIYKNRKAYGWDKMNGWITRLVPYVRDHGTGAYSVRNPMFAVDLYWEPQLSPSVNGIDPGSFHGHAEGPSINSRDLPSGLSSVPFKVVCMDRTDYIQLLGGFVGIEQNGEGALRPKLGLAVRREAGLGKALQSVPEGCRLLPPLSPADFSEGYRRLAGADPFEPTTVPGELNTFYMRHDGIEFSNPNAGKFRSFADLAMVSSFVEGESRAYRDATAGNLAERFAPLAKAGQKPMLRYFDFADGSFLAIETGHLRSGRQLVRRIDGTSGQCLAVLGTFNETLERILAGGGVLSSSG